MQPELPQDYTGKQIAVVGSGPSGLACAAQLNKVAQLFIDMCTVVCIVIFRGKT